eukprot:7391864-Prymnesium_polylepis.1
MVEPLLNRGHQLVVARLEPIVMSAALVAQVNPAHCLPSWQFECGSAPVEPTALQDPNPHIAFFGKHVRQELQRAAPAKLRLPTCVLVHGDAASSLKLEPCSERFATYTNTGVRLDKGSKTLSQRERGRIRKAELTLAAPQRVVQARAVSQLLLHLAATFDWRRIRQERRPVLHRQRNRVWMVPPRPSATIGGSEPRAAFRAVKSVAFAASRVTRHASHARAR